MKFRERAYTNLVEDSIDLYINNILPNNKTIAIQPGNLLPNNTRTTSHFLLFY